MNECNDSRKSLLSLVLTSVSKMQVLIRCMSRPVVLVCCFTDIPIRSRLMFSPPRLPTFLTLTNPCKWTRSAAQLGIRFFSTVLLSVSPWVSWKHDPINVFSGFKAVLMFSRFKIRLIRSGTPWKGHSRLTHRRIRYHFIVYLHITNTRFILICNQNQLIGCVKAHSKTGFSVNDWILDDLWFQVGVNSFQSRVQVSAVSKLTVSFNICNWRMCFWVLPRLWLCVVWLIDRLYEVSRMAISFKVVDNMSLLALSLCSCW